MQDSMYVWIKALLKVGLYFILSFLNIILFEIIINPKVIQIKYLSRKYCILYMLTKIDHISFRFSG